MKQASEPPVVRVKAINRAQIKFKVCDIEALIEATHPARAIWAILEGLDLRRFYEPIKALPGLAGRDAWDPRVLIALLIYAYSRGISSAREMSRLCACDPAFIWITADQVVNYHTLAAFRLAHGAALKRLLIDVLAAMSSQGLVTLQRVMVDGTKIEAQASAHSFRRAETIKEHLALAERQVEQLEQAATAELSQRTKRRRATAAREKRRRLEQALGEAQRLQQAAAKQSPRVSETEPEARLMKHASGAYEPSYNAQLVTDAAQKIIVGFSLTQAGSDAQQLAGALAVAEANTGQRPTEVVADGGYVSAANL